jgi:hypothetical protein
VRIPSDVEICSDYGSDTFDMHQKTQGVVLPRPKSADRRNEHNFYQKLLRASWNEYRMEQVGSDNGNDGPYDSLEHYESSKHHGRKATDEANSSERAVPGAEQPGDAGEVRAVLHELRVLASLLLLPEAGD